METTDEGKNITGADLQARLDAANAEIARLSGLPSVRAGEVQKQLDAANAEIARLQGQASVREIAIPVNTKRIVIPDAFPDGFGFAGNRDRLQPETRSYLQKCWAVLTDDDKVKHLLNLEQHVPQDLPQAPHRPVN